MILNILKRQYSTSKNTLLKSCEIRKIFLNYFINLNNHKFIKSSPIVPLCDKTVAFVNAGMNQFKSILLGKTAASHRRVANSQKCVRVGGKHNDLNIVGRDGYHHTFFEMLGNWSFGDYFKKEACTMALELIKGPLKINTSRLYFTYFAGDKNFNLPADLECYEIWRSLGIPQDRILPFRMKDNFWEMGATGPCGPCTEIHIDHVTNNNRSNLVNTGRSDLTELWNIVFIQYDRKEDGTIIQLPEKHVDTGMGFERLVAILQNKSSNYDTDLFTPIFESIHKNSNLPQYAGSFVQNSNTYDLDVAYRIIADHARMITACLSDGMLPDQNQKLRRVLRTALLLSENVFGNKSLLYEIVPKVVEILGPTYNEMELKFQDTLEIISHEQEVFKALRLSSSKDFKEILEQHPQFDCIDLMELPGFVPAFKELQVHKESFSNNFIPGNVLFKLYDTFGLNDEAVQKLAEIENLKVDWTALKDEQLQVKLKSKQNLYGSSSVNHVKLEDTIKQCTLNCEKTESQFKYMYDFNSSSIQYEVPVLEAKILKLIQNDREQDEIVPNQTDTFGIITDKSNFYTTSGGQESDCGIIRIWSDDKVLELQIENVQEINNNIIHIGKFNKSLEDHKVVIGKNVELIVNNAHRSQNIFHHTATHLLNAAVRNLFNKPTYQTSSYVNHKELKLELSVIGKKIGIEELREIEELIRKVIVSGSPIILSTINSNIALEQPDIITVPGEIYPENGLRLISIKDKNLNFISKELCCGTHARNTKHLTDFCITNFKQTNRARYAFTAIAGESAKEAFKLTKIYSKRIENLEHELKNEPDKHLLVDSELQKIKNKIMHTNICLPYTFKIEIIDQINNILKKLKDASRTTLKEFIEIEMQSILQQRPRDPFIIHFLDSSTLVESVPLQKATRLCTNRPIMVISVNDNKVKARCCVPENLINSTFTAISWMNEFAKIFHGQCSPPKGQNLNEVCNMKPKKILSSIFEDQLELAIENAKNFANKRM